MATHRVAARLVAPVLAAARAAGVDEQRLLQGAGISAPPPPQSGCDAFITLAQYFDVWERAMTETGLADLPLRAATAFGTDSFGVIGFACMTSATVGEAFSNMARYHGVLNTGSLWKQTKEGTQVALTFEIQAGPPLATRGAVEYALAEAVHFSTLVTGRPVPIIEVRIPHAAPPDDGPYRRHFKAPIRWKAAVASLVLAPAALQIGLLKADPHLRAYFEARADALAQRHASEEELSARIRQLVIAALPSGLPVLDRLARKVGLSARSLRRHLAAEGTSFQELVEETRSELSRQYLRDSRLNISEIAFMLGFSDLSPFQRAFRRWNNVTPRTFRERALARPPAVPRSGTADAGRGQPLGR